MTRRVGIEVSLAVAEAARLANVDVVSAYPITPQTHIVERLAEMVSNGELDAEFIPVESEHSAMSACLGSSAVGARTFTATAGQGLELMHEVLYIATAMRLPIVMAVANRALSGPLNVWGDHSDVMSARDIGWIQAFAENGQEAFDLTLWAFRVAEDRGVLLPTMVNLDGFTLSHVIEPMMLLDEAEVKSYLPPNRYPLPLHPDRPVTMGAFAPPPHYTEARKAQDMALTDSKATILKAWQEFGDLFGRYYKPVETYRADDAKVLLLTMGSFGETASVAVDALRDKGEQVGLVKLRLWRPFPFQELRQAVRNAETLVVLDRALSLGGPGGPVCSEVRSALYMEEKKPKVYGFIGGLGGRDMTPEDFEALFGRARDLARKGVESEFEMIGVRE